MLYRKTGNLDNVFHLACTFVSSGSEFLLKSGHGIWIFCSWFIFGHTVIDIKGYLSLYSIHIEKKKIVLYLILFV